MGIFTWKCFRADDSSDGSGSSEKLLSAQTADEFLQMIDEAEEAKFGAESEHDKEKENTAETDRGDERYRIVAVTACPTGIAHTYMAAEALEQKQRSWA